DETVILPIINKEKSTNKDTTPKVDKKIKLEGMDGVPSAYGKFVSIRITNSRNINV
ncbi:copper oxidase, partial [Listeria monocytogenes]|nr:copper oxidase [Listeria monocytogenes]EAE9781058.1 copper oxidase [Listeria monocytogenes]